MLSMLKKNDVFGEIALVEHTRRTATARSFEPSLLLSITKEKFDKLFEVFPDFRQVMEPLLAHRTANTLRKVEVLDKLTKEKLELLGGLMTFVDFAAGDVIEEEGADTSSLYIIMTGTVQCSTRNRATGETVVLSTLGEGQIMGEMGEKRARSLSDYAA